MRNNDDDNCQIIGEGTFCSPECATAFLFNSKLDDSLKSESYQLMNYYYSNHQLQQNNANIKPALSPYYLLDKYNGTLTIKEYRDLNKSQHMLLLINKPVTKYLPELHIDSEMGHLTKNSYSKYKIRRQSEKIPTNRNLIIKQQFGLV